MQYRQILLFNQSIVHQIPLLIYSTNSGILLLEGMPLLGYNKLVKDTPKLPSENVVAVTHRTCFFVFLLCESQLPTNCSGSYSNTLGLQWLVLCKNCVKALVIQKKLQNQFTLTSTCKVSRSKGTDVESEQSSVS